MESILCNDKINKSIAVYVIHYKIGIGVRELRISLIIMF